jgi:hypothetical protein
MDSPPRPKAPSPSGNLPVFLPKTETGFFVNYQVISDAAQVFDAEWQKMFGVSSGVTAKRGTADREGTYQEFADAKYDTGELGTYLRGYPAVEGLASTVRTAPEIIEHVYFRHYFLRWGEIASLLKDVVDKHVGAEANILDLLRQEQGQGEARGWEGTGPLPGVYRESWRGEKSGVDGLNYYEQPIRQEAHAGDWHASDREVAKVIQQMTPDRTERAGRTYRHMADRVHESRDILHAQAAKLVIGWEGPAADGALGALQRLYDLGRHLVDTCWQISDAFQWHADKQRVWQKAASDDGSWLEDRLNWNSDEGERLKEDVQHQTVETNTAFPESVSSV